jgi:uncharacterized protein
MCRRPAGIGGARDHMEAMLDRANPPRARCSICGKPAVEQFRPFCSRRCRDVDLNRWLSGVYAVPVREEEDEDGAPHAKPSEETS